MDYLQKNQVFEAPRGTRKSTKYHKKSSKKVIDEKMEVGMDVGRLGDRILVDFGTILGAKLAPKWHQNQKKRSPKTMSENEYKKKAARKALGASWIGFGSQNENIFLAPGDG